MSQQICKTKAYISDERSSWKLTLFEYRRTSLKNRDSERNEFHLAVRWRVSVAGRGVSGFRGRSLQGGGEGGRRGPRWRPAATFPRTRRKESFSAVDDRRPLRVQLVRWAYRSDIDFLSLSLPVWADSTFPVAGVRHVSPVPGPEPQPPHLLIISPEQGEGEQELQLGPSCLSLDPGSHPKALLHIIHPPEIYSKMTFHKQSKLRTGR